MASISVPPTTSAAPGERQQVSFLQRMRQLSRNYWLRVVVQGVITIVAVTTFTFFLIRLMPGNPIDIKIEELMVRQNMTFDEAYRATATMYNFDPDRPVLLQYVDFIAGLAQGNLGTSLTRVGVPVLDIVLYYLPWTLFCIGLALIVSFTLGVLIGLAMGYWRGGWFDNVMTAFASTVSGIPDYIIALLIILIFGVQLKWFNVGASRGGVDPTITAGFTLEYIGSVLQHAFLPVLVYVLASIGTWTLSMKSSTISTLGEDYIAVAKARGLSEGRILTAYIGRNAMLPLVTRLAISVGFMIGGSVIIEQMFQYPGLGNNLAIAISGRDYTLMQGIFLVITIAVVFSNILSDVVIGWLDPRVRVSKKAD